MSPVAPPIPRIPLVENGATAPRPRWSVMIPTYNCARFLETTLQSVLAKAPRAEEMEIVVVDDCSTKDDPESVVRRVGRGRVSFTRNEKNLGASATFNRCLALSRGELVHILHGDDVALPDLYSKAELCFAASPECGAVASRVATIDTDGRWIELGRVMHPEDVTPLSLFTQNTMTAPAVMIRRAVVEKTGGFREDLVHSADWDLWKRISLVSRIEVLDEPLLLYRVHPGQDTGRLTRTGGNIRDMAHAIAVSRDYTSAPELLTALSAARRNVAQIAVRSAARFALAGDYQACLAQLRAARTLTPLPVAAIALGRSVGRRALGLIKPRQAR
jgi:glycosyltransferase involved in cell wall biosynthesis